MQNLMRGALLAALVGCVGTSSALGDSYTLSLTELEGVRFSYGDSITTPIDFGQSFAQIDEITVTITGTGHTGSAYVSGSWGDPWNPSLIVVDLDAEFIVFIGDDGEADSVFFNDFGVFGETTTTNEHTETETQPLLNGIGSLRLETNYILSIGGGGALPIELSYVDIESASVTVTGTTTASFGDPTADGFIGLDDLDLVLKHWNQMVTPGDISKGELTGDGFVSLEDLDVILNNWNIGTPSYPTTLPEPASVGMALMMICGVLTRRI